MRGKNSKKRNGVFLSKNVKSIWNLYRLMISPTCQRRPLESADERKLIVTRKRYAVNITQYISKFCEEHYRNITASMQVKHILIHILEIYVLHLV